MSCRLRRERSEESISQERASNGQELDALRRELAEKNQLIREQANDLQQDEKLRREWHTNQEARVQETLAMQASQWKSHCEELTQHYDAQVALDAERVSEMERDLDELSSKLHRCIGEAGAMGNLVERGIYRTDGRPSD